MNSIVICASLSVSRVRCAYPGSRRRSRAAGCRSTGPAPHQGLCQGSGLRPSLARAQGDEEFVQLLERLGHSIHAPGGEGTVENFLRGIEVVHDQQRLAAFFLERHRGDGPPSSPSSLVQTRREGGVTSMYLPKNSICFEASLANTRRYLPPT